MKKVQVNKAFASKVLSIVDKGLTHGLGDPEPGKMCVEAAVAFASGEDHKDNPSCVDSYLASEKIDLNDDIGWKSNKARARGLRRVAIAQLGSKGKFNAQKYSDLLRKLSEPMTAAYNEKQLRDAKTTAIKAIKIARDGVAFNEACLDARIDLEDIWDDSGFASPANDAPNYVDLLAKVHPKWGRQKCLFETAEALVTVLKQMKIPGTKYLYLTERKRKKAKAKRKR